MFPYILHSNISVCRGAQMSAGRGRARPAHLVQAEATNEEDDELEDADQEENDTAYVLETYVSILSVFLDWF